MKKILEFLFGGSRTVDKALDLASEHIVDADKRNELFVRLIEKQADMDMQATIPWVDALHKLGRQLLWFALIGVYFYCRTHAIEIDFAELAMLVTGPAAYTIMKGKGK